MKLNVLIMAGIALAATACSKPDTAGEQPITKPEIRIEGGRLTPEALWAMGRIGSVAIDAEHQQLAYTVSYYSVAENRSTTWIRICAWQDGALLPQEELVGSEPAWTQGGELLYLKGGKLYVHTGEEDKCIEGFQKDIEGFLLSPDDTQILLVAAVKTVQTTAERYPDLPKASGRIVTDLMYKHWDEWVETAPHPFVGSFDLKKQRIGKTIDLLDGTAYESPMRPFGGIEQLAWSPDSKEIAYTCRAKTGLEYALSTNSDIYLYRLADGSRRNITESNKGYDTNPAYSPDGKYIAWLSMERDGYESDENRLFIMDRTTGEQTFLSKGLDTNVDSYYWKDGNSIVFNAVWHATEMLYETNLQGERTCLTNGQYDFEPCGNIGDTYICLRHSMREANELFAFSCGGEIRQLTTENQNIYSQIEMGRVEPRWQPTTDGKQMLTWIIYPPHFDPSRKYPTLLYCEGGPQSPVSQFWSFRWNFMMMAANDYIIVAPNRRGLPGFGKAWNEQISGDYGGQCMRDYLSAIDEFVAAEPYVDKEHLGCVGASFGGYSVYWLAGHHDGRFKAFIAHDGIFNMEMQYLETEEKWFANWDMGGAYWDRQNAVAQRTFANSPHKFVDKWDTPILCIHGEKDYRILANQAMAAFDAAKMRGIPAELLVFPDENHWVLQPQNGILWQRTFFDWLNHWLKN
ncbi:MAG: prolyl oligopeptidase family serine peptidase [Paludibacteraceae bacterium]